MTAAQCMGRLKLILMVSVAMASAADQNARSCSTSIDCVWSAIAGGGAGGGGGHWRCDMGICVPIKVATK